MKVLDNPLNLKSDYDCIEWFDSRLLSRDNFTDVIPKFLKRRGLVARKAARRIARGCSAFHVWIMRKALDYRV